MAKILIVEDDEPFRKMLIITLGKLHHEVVEARNGREAIRIFEAALPDVVLTDLIMPEKDGLETIAELRRLHAPVKIIAMSGGGRGDATDYLKVARLMGAIVTLHKPFTTDALAAAIEAAVSPA